MFKDNSQTFTTRESIPESGYLPYEDLYDTTGTGGENPSKWKDFVDSFKRFEMDEIDPRLSEAEKAMIATATSPLSKQLKGRHIQMIAIGSAVGTGLFIGSGGALRTGGPAAVIIAWALVGTMVFCTVQALGELAATFPVPGAMCTYMTKFMDTSWGFAMGWNYIVQWCVVLPLELVSASIVINYWDSNIDSSIWVAIFLVLILVLNFFGVKGYGETEFILSLIKVIGIVGFIIFGVAVICGGGPTHKYFGGKYWNDPGAFAHGFKGLASVFVTAAFSFNGSELMGLTAAEAENPRKSIPRATKQIFWRIVFFYMLSLTVIGCLVPYTETRLIAESSGDSAASPFVLAIKNAGVNGLPSVMNVIILFAVLSVGNSAVYANSRILAAMSNLQMAPKIFGYIDRRGRPLVGIATSGVFGLLCFVVRSGQSVQVFEWLVALTGLSCIFTWGSICVCHIRFRYTLHIHGRGTDELPFSSQVGVYGSYYGLVLNIIVLIAQFWIALFPIGGDSNAQTFFKAYLCLFVVLLLYIGHKIWKRNWRLYIPVEEIDIDSGRREFDLEYLKQEIQEDKEYLRTKPFYVRWFNVWC